MTIYDHVRRRARTTGVLAAGCLLAAGCGGGDAPAASEGAASGAEGGDATCEDIGTVRIGLTSSASDAPFYIATERGYFEEVGITPELTDFASAAQMIAPLGGGQLDVGAGAPSAGFYNALTRQIDFRIVADKGSMPTDYGYMPLLVRTDLFESGEVTSAADLGGLRVAEPAQGTATASTLNTILESEGLDYGDVSHEYIGFAEHLTAYENEAIDASLTTEPSATLIEEAGLAVRLGTPPDWYDAQQLAVILYSEDFVGDNAEAGICTMIAYLRGVRDYVDALDGGAVAGEDADEITRIVTEATGLTPELYGQITPNWVDPDGEVNRESIETDFVFFEGEGLLEGEVDLEAIIDTSFAEAAVEELGAWDGERP